MNPVSNIPREPYVPRNVYQDFVLLYESGVRDTKILMRQLRVSEGELNRLMVKYELRTEDIGDFDFNGE